MPNGSARPQGAARRHFARLRDLAARFSTVRAAAVFALSGAAFAVGNLLLARVMPVEQFGRFVLAMALFNIFAVIAPIGLDQVMLRHAIGSGGRMLGLLLAAGAGIGAAVGLGSVLIGGFAIAEAAMLAAAILAGGIIFAVVAGFRAAMREVAGLVAMTYASWLLLAIGLLGLLLPMHTALAPLALFTLGELVGAVLGWMALRRARRGQEPVAVAIPWAEARSLLGIAAIGTIAVQMERLLVPVAIGIESLALFSVLASVAIFPFRMVTAGAGFGLVPKLRATSDPALRRRLVRHDLLSIAVLLVGASACVILAAPMVTTMLTRGRYEIGTALVVSACFNGSAKVAQVIPRSILTGCGDARDMALLNRLGWLGLLVSVAGAFAGAGWGLIGVVCGIAIGSLCGSLPAVWLAWRRLAMG